MRKTVTIEEAVKSIVKLENEQTGLNPDYVFGYMDGIIILFDIKENEMKDLKKKVEK